MNNNTLLLSLNGSFTETVKNERIETLNMEEIWSLKMQASISKITRSNSLTL
jgi:hypothetical protein